LKSKVSGDNPADNDPDLLNFVMMEFGITYWMGSLPQMCYLDSRKLDYPV
jgi:hypothetical protein